MSNIDDMINADFYPQFKHYEVLANANMNRLFFLTASLFASSGALDETAPVKADVQSQRS